MATMLNLSRVVAKWVGFFRCHTPTIPLGQGLPAIAMDGNETGGCGIPCLLNFREGMIEE
jgi:hypothetical protein